MNMIYFKLSPIDQNFIIKEMTEKIGYTDYQEVWFVK